MAPPVKTELRPASTRQRLSPEVRIPLILDAALVEFSARGYSDTRIDDIAARAGVSKGGVYAHFRSKDEVFEALLNRLLKAPPLDIDALLDRSRHVRDLVEHLLADLYAKLTEPGTVAMSRLLIAESARVPALVAQWHAQSVQVLHGQLSTLLRRGVERDLCRHSIVIDQPWLVLAPIISVVVNQLTVASLPGGLSAARQAHADQLVALLSP